MPRILPTAFVIFIILTPALQAQEDVVLRPFTPEAAEKVLQGLKIEFKKSSAKKGEEHYYDFQRNNFRVRLTYFSPRELMIDCVFRGVPLDKVNQWNTITKVSRASLHKDASGDFTLLEYGLDLAGGVTAGILKQYVARFDEELKKYDSYIASNSVDDVILSTVKDEKIENVLKTIGVTFQKKANNAGVMMFDFELNGHKLRLYNFDGKDLMMDVHFRKLSLEDANGYNLSKKFIRVVNYKGKEIEYTALEINFDCEAGVTEGMIRHWILSFGEDVQSFADYAKKMRGDDKK